GSEIIVKPKPAIVGQQVAIAIQVPAHVIVRIKNKQADFATAKYLPDGRFRRLLKRATIDQSYIVKYIESRQVLFQIPENIPARYSKVFQLSSGFDAHYLF